MKKTDKILAVVVAVVFAGQLSASAKDFALTSPDGRLTVTVSADKPMTYVLSDGDQILVGPSELNMVLDNGDQMGCGDALMRISRRTVNSPVQTMFYKKNVVEDNFNEITLWFKKYSVIFRLYF